MVLYEAEGIQYELFDTNGLDEMAFMVAESFSQYEPLVSYLGISLIEFVDFIRLLKPKLAQEGLSVIARSQDSKQIIGAMVNDDFATEPPEEIQHLGHKFEPVWAILDGLDSQYKQGNSLPEGEYLHLFLLAIDHQQSGKNVKKNLVHASLEYGIKKGYKTGIVEATGVVSQHIFRKFGFLDCFETPYKTFSFQGKRVFESIKDHHGIILMDKALT